ncbi:hypothetical protein D3C78_1065390 [compost metagenome]
MEQLIGNRSIYAANRACWDRSGYPYSSAYTYQTSWHEAFSIYVCHAARVIREHVSSHMDDSVPSVTRDFELYVAATGCRTCSMAHESFHCALIYCDDDGVDAIWI